MQIILPNEQKAELLNIQVLRQQIGGQSIGATMEKTLRGTRIVCTEMSPTATTLPHYLFLPFAANLHRFLTKVQNRFDCL